ncbi:EF-hand domain pair [Franzmannia pantelleriensis]|uniref:EF-hand domain pair n=1 Tax=Franzmannia pantelleriensis TaxID=48727 RepID=A0A1G9UXP6_9GAMM|nr:EF-hand domain-containing protein [Halomonas pantelleriensis]SDM64712.1 EF-hand domain pair [Halomonas pantelleriensis]
MRTKRWVMAGLMVGLLSASSGWAAGRESSDYDPVRLVFTNDMNHTVRYMFSELDSDGNGVISAAEAKRDNIERAFSRLDLNRDGQVTRNEFRQHRLT